MAPCDTLVREATAADSQAAAVTTARAFLNYNWMVHTIQEEGRLDRLTKMMRIFIDEIVLPSGFMWVTDDASAVSMWGLTDAHANPFMAPGLAERMATLAGDMAPNFFGFEEHIDRYQPDERAFYLSSLAVDPSCQGKGLATRILEPGFTTARELGLPVRLDTSTLANKAMYEHLGFETIAEIPMPGDVFTTWLMRRP